MPWFVAGVVHAYGATPTPSRSIQQSWYRPHNRHGLTKADDFRTRCASTEGAPTGK